MQGGRDGWRERREGRSGGEGNFACFPENAGREKCDAASINKEKPPIFLPPFLL